MPPSQDSVSEKYSSKENGKPLINKRKKKNADSGLPEEYPEGCGGQV